jgi:hypothetical protein
MSVLDVFEAARPDDGRVRACLETVERYLNGDATDDELGAARAAAWAAEAAAEAAAGAAEAAARAAAARIDFIAIAKQAINEDS